MGGVCCFYPSWNIPDVCLYRGVHKLQKVSNRFTEPSSVFNELAFLYFL